MSVAVYEKGNGKWELVAVFRMRGDADVFVSAIEDGGHYHSYLQVREFTN